MNIVFHSTGRVLCLMSDPVTANVFLKPIFQSYEGRAKSSVTNRLPYFYPRYVLKCFNTLEWCVE